MKKLISVLIALVLCTACASASVIYGGDNEAVKTAAEQLAESLSVEAICFESEIEAVNYALVDESYICVSTQQVMIDGLQGYSNADLRTNLVFTAFPAISEYYLICTPETAEIYGEFTDLGTFLEENEYALVMARTMTASNVDYAATELCNEFYFDQQLFYDEEEVFDMMGEDAYVYIVNEEDKAAAEALGFTVMGALKDILDVDGDVICVSSLSGNAVDTSAIDLSGFGYRAFDLGEESAADYAKHLFKEYMSYMTAEGLCFYEE